jgi:hypothetical protein
MRIYTHTCTRTRKNAANGGGQCSAAALAAGGVTDESILVSWGLGGSYMLNSNSSTLLTTARRRTRQEAPPHSNVTRTRRCHTAAPHEAAAAHPSAARGRGTLGAARCSSSQRGTSPQPRGHCRVHASSYSPTSARCCCCCWPRDHPRATAPGRHACTHARTCPSSCNATTRRPPRTARRSRTAEWPS